jgi:hypothetical protein
MRKKIFVSGQLEQSTQDKNLMYRHDKPNKPTKERLLSYVLLESPFASVSTVSRGHRSLDSLDQPEKTRFLDSTLLTLHDTTEFTAFYTVVYVYLHSRICWLHF